MKTLILSLSLLLVAFTSNASIDSIEKGKKPVAKKEQLKDAMQKEVYKHIFFPENSKEALEGSADVLLQVYPEGDVRVVLIQSKNPLVKAFIERQVNKMKVNSDVVVVGEIFKYRFSFKKK